MCDPKEEKTSTADNHPGLGSLEIEDVTTEMKQPPLPLGDADTADERVQTDPGFTHQPQDTD